MLIPPSRIYCCEQSLPPETYRCPKCKRVLDPENDPLRAERDRIKAENKERIKARYGIVSNSIAILSADRAVTQAVLDVGASEEDDELIVTLKNLQTAIKAGNKERIQAQYRMSSENADLRTALNNLIGAIINKKVEGLEEDIEEACTALEFKSE